MVLEEIKLTALREAVRRSLNDYKRALGQKLDSVPRGSGHADNEFDHLKISISQVDSAKRVLWMED
jgi:hypothetical protein